MKKTKKLSFRKGRNTWHKWIPKICNFTISSQQYCERENALQKGWRVSIRVNNNTMKSEIKCVYRVNFTKPHNIGSLLGFSSNHMLESRQWHKLNVSINININILHIECNLTAGAITTNVCTRYTSFSPSMPPGYKISERPMQIIYLSIVWSITDLTFRIVDQDGCSISGEITVKLHVRRQQRWSSNDNMRCLFWMSRRNRLEIFFAREMTALKNYRSVEKNSLRRTLNFYNHWVLSYEIWDGWYLEYSGESIASLSSNIFHTSTRRLNIDEIRIPCNSRISTRYRVKAFSTSK